MIVQHHTGLHLMYLHSDHTWQCLNGNPFADYLPADLLYQETLEKIRARNSVSVV